MEEVVVTGMGLVSCLGHNPKTLWENLLAGKSGVDTIQRFDTEGHSVKIAGEVRGFDPSPYFSPRDAKRTARAIQYGVHAATDALKQANLDPKSINPARGGVIVGSGMGGMNVFQDNAIALGTRGPRRVSPFFVPMAISNMPGGEIAIRTGWMGPNFGVVSACATGNHAIITAADQIRLGRTDVMIAGGVEEAVCGIGVAGFAIMRALSTRNDDPKAASRPFDVDRDGFIMAEGAGVLVLESRSHAEKRGATILARLAGYGASCDASHISAPRADGAGVKIAIDSATAMAGIDISEIGYVNTHGTSTPLGDIAEARAVYNAFGGKVDNLKINSTKSMVGHALGAAAGMEAAVTIMSLNEQKIHQTLNLENQEPEIKMDCVAGANINHSFDYALSNSFGFGGNNSSVLFARN